MKSRCEANGRVGSDRESLALFWPDAVQVAAKEVREGLLFDRNVIVVGGRHVGVGGGRTVQLRFELVEAFGELHAVAGLGLDGLQAGFDCLAEVIERLRDNGAAVILFALGFERVERSHASAVH